TQIPPSPSQSQQLQHPRQNLRVGAVAAGAVEDVGDEGGVAEAAGGQPVLLGRGGGALCQGAEEVAGLAAADLDPRPAEEEIDLDHPAPLRIELRDADAEAVAGALPAGPAGDLTGRGRGPVDGRL